MPSVDKPVPTLDGSNLIFDKYFPSTVARTATTIPTTDKGAAGGVAPLDASQHVPAANHVSGGVLAVTYNGTTPTSRPTSRTDITVFVAAPAGTTRPAWMLTTDRFDTF